MNEIENFNIKIFWIRQPACYNRQWAGKSLIFNHRVDIIQENLTMKNKG